MKKILIVILILVMTLVMAACGGSSSKSDEAAAEESRSNSSYDGFTEYDAEANYAEAPASAEYGSDADMKPSEDMSGGTVGLGLPSSVKKDRVKLIYTANMNIQTLDFDEAVKGLNDLVSKFGGYFEAISTDNGGYFADDSYRYGSYTVRIPSDKYQKFINSVSEGMHVVNLNQNAEDIGQVYFETERRVETLKNKHDRLEELLKKAEKMKDIIELESALSDTEYELEQYTSELNRYDSLVNYSTVYVYIEKVSQYSTGIEEQLTFGQRLMRSLASGAADFGYWLEDLINWIGYHLIQLIILAVIVVAVVKSRVLSKIGEGSEARRTARAEKKRIKAEMKNKKENKKENNDQGEIK